MHLRKNRLHVHRKKPNVKPRCRLKCSLDFFYRCTHLILKLLF